MDECDGLPYCMRLMDHPTYLYSYKSGLIIQYNLLNGVILFVTSSINPPSDFIYLNQLPTFDGFY
jgi:hypothetical protein